MAKLHSLRDQTSGSPVARPLNCLVSLPPALSLHTLSTHSGQGAAGHSPKFVASDTEQIKMEAKTQDRREAA